MTAKSMRAGAAVALGSALLLPIGEAGTAENTKAEQREQLRDLGDEIAKCGGLNSALTKMPGISPAFVEQLEGVARGASIAAAYLYSMSDGGTKPLGAYTELAENIAYTARVDAASAIAGGGLEEVKEQMAYCGPVSKVQAKIIQDLRRSRTFDKH